MSPHAPWHTDAFPEWRDEPPWVMEDMMAAEPGLVPGIDAQGGAADDVAVAVRDAREAGRPVVVVGCGTSEHAAHGVAVQLQEALAGAGVPGPAVEARQAFEAFLDPRPGGVCIAISHEGATRATLAALRAAREAGASTALVTAVPTEDGRALADRILVTPLADRSWCHTVGYLSPLLAGAAIAAAIGGDRFDVRAVERHLDGGLATRRQAAETALRLWGVDRMITAGSGADHVAARELALKVAEAVRLPTAAYETETLLHGHLVPANERTGLVLLVTDSRRRDARAARGRQALGAARALGMRAAAIVTPDVDATLGPELTPAGRLVVGEAPELPATLSSLAATAIALQELTLALVGRAGVNPDLIGREEEPIREAAARAEARFGPEDEWTERPGAQPSGA